ncbi:MAG: hypothetical protein ACRD47_06705, partial [Nitrososphaeraceae archaeon]
HNPYQQYDEDDPNSIFVKGIDLDKHQDPEEDIEIVKSSVDKRVQHVNVKGSLADAISAMIRFEVNQQQPRSKGNA